MPKQASPSTLRQPCQRFAHVENMAENGVRQATKDMLRTLLIFLAAFGLFQTAGALLLASSRGVITEIEHAFTFLLVAFLGCASGFAIGIVACQNGKSKKPTHQSPAPVENPVSMLWRIQREFPQEYKLYRAAFERAEAEERRQFASRYSWNDDNKRASHLVDTKTSEILLSVRRQSDGVYCFRRKIHGTEPYFPGRFATLAEAKASAEKYALGVFMRPDHSRGMSVLNCHYPWMDLKTQAAMARVREALKRTNQ